MDTLPESLNIALQRGIWAFPTKGARSNYAARTDMAEAFANVINTEGHENKIYEITSDKAYTNYEIIDIVNKLLGKEINYVDISINDLVEGLKKADTPDPVIKTIVSIAETISNGELDLVDDSLEKLLRRKPIRLEEFLKKNLVK